MSLFRLLCIDYGEKRIGIALSDPLQILSRPYTVLENNDQVLQKIQDIIQTEKAGKVILGLPLNLAGNDTVKTKEVRNFAEKLRSAISVPVVFWDERYSTDEAHKSLKKMGLNTKQERQVVDKIAASIILKDYLENNPKN